MAEQAGEKLERCLAVVVARSLLLVLCVDFIFALCSFYFMSGTVVGAHALVGPEECDLQAHKDSRGAGPQDRAQQAM